MSPEPHSTAKAHGAGGQLAYAIMHFARVLRAAGLPIGPERVVQSIRAIQAVGVEERELRSRGMRAILPHVDQVHTIHNLKSLAALGRLLHTQSTRID